MLSSVGARFGGSGGSVGPQGGCVAAPTGKTQVCVISVGVGVGVGVSGEGHVITLVRVGVDCEGRAGVRVDKEVGV